MGPRFRGDDVLRGLSFASHRRRDAVAADIDAGGLQRAVFLFAGAEDDDFRARLQLGFIAGDEGDDRRVRRHDDFLFAVLVLDQDVVAVVAHHGLRSEGRRVGTDWRSRWAPYNLKKDALVFWREGNRNWLLGVIGRGHLRD